jgi:hypothetical protein
MSVDALIARAARDDHFIESSFAKDGLTKLLKTSGGKTLHKIENLWPVSSLGAVGLFRRN